MGPLASSNRFAIHREAVTDHVDDPIVAWATVGYTIQRSRSPATAFAFCARAVVRCSALFGSVPRLWADRLGSVELEQLNRCSIVKYERHANSSRWLRRCDQNLPTFQSFVQIVDGEGDVRNDSDDLGHVAMRLEPDPLVPVGTGLKTGDVNPERRDMMLLSTGLRVWNPDVVVPPSELRYHGRRLMVQSHFAGHVSLHRSHSPISIIESVESAEHVIMPTISTVIQRINRQVRLKLMDGAARCRMSRTANPLFPRRAPKVTSNTRPDGFLLH